MNYPFQRKQLNNNADLEKRFLNEVIATLKILSENMSKFQPWVDAEIDLTENLVQNISEILAQRWFLNDNMSEIAFKGLLIVLEYCLGHESSNSDSLAYVIEALAEYNTRTFWIQAIPYVCESDLRYGTSYRDALLFSLVFYDVNSGKNRLKELFTAVPGLRESLLARCAKRFEEAFHQMIQRRQNLSMNSYQSRTPLSSQSRITTESDNDDSEEDENETENASDNKATVDDNDDHENVNVLDKENKISDDNEIKKKDVEDKGDDDENKRQNGKDKNGNKGYDEKKEKVDRKMKYSKKAEPKKPFEAIASDSRQNSKSHISTSSSTSICDSSATASGITSSSTTENKTNSADSRDDVVVTTGIGSHFQERVIAVSNAPPVSLNKRKDSGKWEIGQGSGGLVSCCEPVISKDSSNIWLACFGPGVPLNLIGSIKEDNAQTAVPNTLGLPAVRIGLSEITLGMLHDERKDDGVVQEVKNQMSLLGILKTFNRDNYKLKPVVVPDQDYNSYYCGISNGLLWPAFHNLPEYIASEYDDKNKVRSHWRSYVRVNYHFALNAVRNSRSQDFLWVHDYHLLLTGLIIRALEPDMEVGFFLHIPFQPPDQFFTKYKQTAEAIVRALLNFTKVGFQTHLDMNTYLDAVMHHCSSARLLRIPKSDKHVVSYKGSLCSFGVFPVSIKNEDFLVHVKNKTVLDESVQIKETVMKNRPGKFFFAAERFDYTKGIKEKLAAIRCYFQLHPDRLGKDVFYQVAVINRRAVDMYRTYQDQCIETVKQINKEFVCSTDASWKPIVLQTDGLTRPKLIAHYLAMDVGMVTPIKDGMNLVAKEMIICNSKASLVLSTGAGTELQFQSAKFYSDEQKCYHRVSNIKDAKHFADVLYEAAVLPIEEAEKRSSILNKFLLENDIERWSSSFLDPGWTHEVIQITPVKTFHAFYNLLFETRNIRRQIVARILKGIPLKSHYAVSLKNAQISLEQSRQEGTMSLLLWPTERQEAKISATFDISDELLQLEIDQTFLNFVQNEAPDNLGQFLRHLAKYHPNGVDVFVSEVEDVFSLLKKADHFKYFFTDRDGTLSSYACSYASSVQGAYNGVIQAMFAHRCTQYSAIITSAPLRNVGILDVRVVPIGYYCYGASGGREWYINDNKSFKDNSINDKDLTLLNKVADKISETLEQNDDYVQFTWLGSGLQRHYGHITVARQDCYKSVDEALSAKWLSVINDIVKQFDPSSTRLVVHSTETDIKIYLKSNVPGQIFNKGHGVRLFAWNMNLNLSIGNSLVCADSESDLPMLQELLTLNPRNTFTVWVTKNDELKRKVIDLCGLASNTNYAFATSPLSILGAMAQATIRAIRIRPGTYPNPYVDEQQ